MAEEKNEAEAEAAMRNEEPVAGGLELDDTSEFVRSVTFDPVVGEPKQLALQFSTSAPAPAPVATEGDQAIDNMDVDDEKEDGEADEEDEEAMLNAIEGMITAAAGGTVPSEGKPSGAPEEELDVSVPCSHKQLVLISVVIAGYRCCCFNVWSWYGVDAQGSQTTGNHCWTRH